MFFSQTSYPLAPEHLLGPAKIRGDIHNFVFIASVVDTGYKPFTVVSLPTPQSVHLAKYEKTNMSLKSNPTAFSHFITGVIDTGNLNICANSEKIRSGILRGPGKRIHGKT
jgi:hypothetical protein